MFVTRNPAVTELHHCVVGAAWQDTDQDCFTQTQKGKSEWVTAVKTA